MRTIAEQNVLFAFALNCRLALSWRHMNFAKDGTL